MTVSPSFPPADELLALMRRVDYVKHLNSFMDSVENLCIIVAAVYIILARKWREHKVTERLRTVAVVCIIGLAIVFDYLKETAWPMVRQNAQNVGRFFYTVAHPPLTV